ncbi:MAG: hypothetical protein M3211_08650 [Actinomycetota bacterium]|nr:hypothetical protein [Actinomycetota bacterium]
MRGNGLTADAYAPLAELERSAAADALLALRDAGVAAYAVLPDTDADSDAVTRVAVFADRNALDRARAVVRDLAGVNPVAERHDPPPVDEVAWDQIVRGFSSTATEPPRETLPRADPPPEQRAHADARADEDEHFVPGPPPPPPGLDLVSRLAWTGVLGGPLMLLSAAMLSWAPPRLLVLLCVLGFIGGMVTLVVRMKDRPHDGPDDGAVV